MNFWDKIGIDYKAASVLGVTAFLFSLMLGLISGVGLGTVFVRSLFFMLIFAAIGYGVVYVFKRYVPEFFELVETGEEDMNFDSGDIPETALDEKNEYESSGDSGSTHEYSDDFKEYGRDDFARYETGRDEGLVSTGDTAKSGKKSMGKHIVIDEKTAKFEPKIMAQAVRTMLSKDE